MKDAQDHRFNVKFHGCCVNMARVWHSPHKCIPFSEHNPACKNYVLKKFIKVKQNGTWCVMEEHDAREYIEHDKDSSSDYTVEEIYLTQDQFDNMPEFEGF